MLQGTADTAVTVGAALNEASTVYFVVVPHPSAMPTVTEVSRLRAVGCSQQVPLPLASTGSGWPMAATAAWHVAMFAIQTR